MIAATLRAVTAPKLSYTNVAVAAVGALMVGAQDYLAAVTMLLVGSIVSGIVDHTVHRKA